MKWSRYRWDANKRRIVGWLRKWTFFQIYRKWLLIDNIAGLNNTREDDQDEISSAGTSCWQIWILCRQIPLLSVVVMVTMHVAFICPGSPNCKQPNFVTWLNIHIYTGTLGKKWKSRLMKSPATLLQLTSFQRSRTTVNVLLDVRKSDWKFLFGIFNVPN